MFALSSITQLVALSLTFGYSYQDNDNIWQFTENYVDNVSLSNNDIYTLDGTYASLLEFDNSTTYLDSALGGVYTYLGTRFSQSIVDDTEGVNNKVIAKITCVNGTGINMTSMTWQLIYDLSYSSSTHLWTCDLTGNSFFTENGITCNLMINPFVVTFDEINQLPSIYWGKSFICYASPQGFISTTNFRFPDSESIYFGLRFSLINADYATYEEGLAEQFNFGYREGYGQAEEDLTTEYENKLADAVSEASQQAYSQGLADGANPDYDGLLPIIFTGILDIALLPVNVFLGMLNFELFGINIGGFVSSLLTLTVVIMLIKVITGKNGADKE